MLPNGRFENLNNVVPKGWKSSTVEALKESSKVGLIEINVSSVHNFDGCTQNLLTSIYRISLTAIKVCNSFPLDQEAVPADDNFFLRRIF